MNNNNPEKIIVMVGPPGVGKSTIREIISTELVEFTCLDGDDFISQKGIKRLQTGQWDDNDRKDYLSAAAKGVTGRANSGEKIILTDAMTTSWMRDFFENKIRAQGNFALAWVLVSRNLTEREIEDMVTERAKRNHPMNSVAIFKKYYNAFEPISQDHLTLNNPGPVAGKSALVLAVNNLLTKIYEN